MFKYVLGDYQVKALACERKPRQVLVTNQRFESDEWTQTAGRVVGTQVFATGDIPEQFPENPKCRCDAFRCKNTQILPVWVTAPQEIDYRAHSAV